MAKNILIFSDGTGQAGGVAIDERRSNIYKLYRATRVAHDSDIDPAQQLAYYDAGLGSKPPGGGTIRRYYRKFHNFVSQATGYGLTTNIIDCYEMIIRAWRPGDRIFLFGFSRGAYTARCLGGVLAQCGVPTRLAPGVPMKYDSGTARRLAREAVKTVYQHTASKTLSLATARENELLEQRRELARQFREKHGVDQSDKSHYPYFIGVFDTVAAVASPGSMIILILAFIVIAAGFAAGLWWLTPWFGSTAGSFLSYLFGFAGISTARWSHWFYVVAGLFILIGLAWYLVQTIRFAPHANPRKPWRTFTMSFGRMQFEDKTFNDNVKYARHALSIDEDRASFKRVGWGSASSGRPDKDAQGVNTFEQIWFAGNHSDVGGSYPEAESRLSDFALAWMVDAAAKIENAVKIDQSALHLFPAAGGMQHDQRRAGVPVLTGWLGITWPGKRRQVASTARLHPSVLERAALPAVLQYDSMVPYRPEGLRKHRDLGQYYADIPEPQPRGRFAAFLASFRLAA